MNIDPAYVAAHHVVRFVALVIAVPLLARRLAQDLIAHYRPLRHPGLPARPEGPADSRKVLTEFWVPDRASRRPG